MVLKGLDCAYSSFVFYIDSVSHDLMGPEYPRSLICVIKMRRVFVAGSLLLLARPAYALAPWKPCPVTCENASPSDWTYYHDLQTMNRCGETMIFDLSLYNPVNTSEPLFTVRTCTAVSAPNAENANPRSDLDITESLNSVRLSTNGITTRRNTDNLISALESLASYIKGSNQSEKTILFSKKADAVAGVYAGAQVERTSAAEATQNLIDYLDNIDADSVPQRISIQLCPETNATSSQIFGVYAHFENDVSAVQTALRHGLTLGAWLMGLTSVNNGLTMRFLSCLLCCMKKAMLPNGTGIRNAAHCLHALRVNTSELPRAMDVGPWLKKAVSHRRPSKGTTKRISAQPCRQAIQSAALLGHCPISPHSPMQMDLARLIRSKLATCETLSLAPII